MKKPIERKQLGQFLVDSITVGKMPMLGSYIGCKTSSREYVSKTTGKKMPLKIAAHIVIVGDEQNAKSITVEEMLPDDFDVATYANPAKRGDEVVVFVSQVKEERGATTARPEKDGFTVVAA